MDSAGQLFPVTVLGFLQEARASLDASLAPCRSRWAPYPLAEDVAGL